MKGEECTVCLISSWTRVKEVKGRRMEEEMEDEE